MSLCGHSHSLAQQTPAAPAVAVADEIVTLSVFEVTDTRDVGYHASTTLAGTGTGEDLKNIPMSVDVLTKEFLEDIGATDIYEASRYALGGEFNPNDGDATSGPDLRSFSFRGFRTAWQTRDFFIWSLPADGYSYERLDFMRGPNAVLAGDAEPGGVMNINTKRAHWKNRATLGARVGSWGRYRGTLDWNRAITKNWAIRLNAVHAENGSWKDWVNDERKSVHLTTTLKLGRNTQLRLEGEIGRLEQRPAFSLPRESYSDWERAGLPSFIRYSDGGTEYGTSRLGSASATAVWWVYDSVTKKLNNWNGMGQTNGPSTTSNASKPVSDERIHPRDMQLAGPDMHLDRDYHTYTGWFEHRFTRSLTLELAYNYQTYTRTGLLAGVSELRRDPNLLLYDGITPNPHYGEAYASISWQDQWQRQDVDSYRAALVYEWDALSWTKQRFHLGFGLRDETMSRVNKQERWVNNSTTASLTGSSTSIARRVYVSDGRNMDALRFGGLLNDPDTGVITDFVAVGNMDKQHNFVTYGHLAASGEYLDGKIRTVFGIRRDMAKNKIHSAERDAVTGVYAYVPESPERTVLDVYNTSLSAGLIYNWWDPLSLFFNYSESFRPANQAVILINGNPPGPRLGRGKEAGVRLNLLKDRIQVSASVFDITQENYVIELRAASSNPLPAISAIWGDPQIAQLDPEYMNNRLPATANVDVETNSGRGFELEVFTNITPGWTLQAGYGFVDNEAIATCLMTRAYIEKNMDGWEAMAASDPAIEASIRPELNALKNFMATQIPGSKSLRSNRH
ncbi:MAG: hypothetical protein LBC18_05895, partial [Opitutaceae bacterium]|nr:hypothetical protein [Opitutaceae bacterium]